MKDKKSQGKKNRASGQRFEIKVRKDLEKKGWIVDRWSNQVDLDKDKGVPDFEGSKEVVTQSMPQPKLVKAKSNRFNMRTTGFPDFLAFRLISKKNYEVRGVECRGGDEKHRYLDKEEKEKCFWLLENNIFSKILVAMKDQNKRGNILYKEFKK